jgi:hypothetical protein
MAGGNSSAGGGGSQARFGAKREGLSSAQLEKRAKAEWGRYQEMIRQAQREVLEGAEVVVSTCSGAGEEQLLDKRWVSLGNER